MQKLVATRQVRLSATRVQEIRHTLQTGSLSEIQALDLDPNLNIDGWTPLTVVANRKLPDDQICNIASYFLDRGADPNGTGWLNRTALHFAAAQNNAALTQLLLTHPKSQGRVCVDQTDVLGDSPMHRAAICGSRQILESLLEAGATLDLQNTELKSPLVRAASISPVAKRSPTLADNIAYLESRGASNALTDVYGHNYAYYTEQSPPDPETEPIAPVDDAAQRKNWVMQGNREELGRLFSDASNQVMAPVTYLGDSVVSTAALFGKADLLRMFQTFSGFDANHQNRENKRPLYWAVYFSHRDALDVLLSIDGIQVNFHESVLGETPLQRAVINRHPLIAAKLITEHGADVTAVNQFGQTPLHLCVIGEVVDRDLLLLLLDSDPPIDAQDEQGRTPLWYAAQNKNRLAAQQLLAKGANPGLADHSGTSPQDLWPTLLDYSPDASASGAMAAEAATSVSTEDRISSYQSSSTYDTRRSTNAGATKFVLSMDGGGIRGVIPAMMACEIEKRTHQPVSQSFDVVAGTSTGGILAAGLTAPGAAANVPRHSAYDMLQLYTTKASDIFPKKPWYKRVLVHRSQMFSVRYDPGPLESIGDYYVGNRRLSNQLCTVLIPTYDAVTRQPFCFNSGEVAAGRQYNFFMPDVIRATSAAPTYFPPHVVGEHIFLDGGVAENNPTLRAVSWLESTGVDKDHMVVVSVGTGEESSKVPISQKTLFRGALFWASTIPGVLMDNASYTTAQTLELQFNTHPGHYFRFQSYLDHPIDLADAGAVPELVDLGAQLIEDHDDEINTVVEKLIT